MGGALLAVRNIFKAWVLLVASCAVFAGIGWLLGGYRLLSIFVFCGALLAAALYWYSDRVALGLVGARELPFAEAPAVHSTVERLAARAGVLKPRLYLMPDGLPRALAAGRGPRGSAVALSSGLISAATPAELEAVIAHELAHVRHRDVVVQTSVVVLAATLLESSRIGGWFQRALLLDQAAELVDFAGSPATEPLYTINPFLEDGLARMFITHPPVEERVRRLRALDPDWRAKLRAA